MNVDDVYKIVQFCTNASINGDISPDEFNRIAPLGEFSYINYLLGSPEQYQYERPVPRVQYSLNENIRQKLSPIIEPPTTLTVDSQGVAAYPTGYILIDAMFTSSMDRIAFAGQNKLHSYLKSVIDPVATNPIYLIQKGQFQFYPITIGSAKISYVKMPATMKWNSAPDGNGRAVYTSVGSVQPVWNDVDIMEVIIRILAVVGVNLQLPIVYQYADQLKKEGA